ncbi:MAG: tetratricopeptide repeat protein [Proteobacteria bacterium]|nr:tetratricopeptide repeat protein [Pseudomonadota bacterium]
MPPRTQFQPGSRSRANTHSALLAVALFFMACASSVEDRLAEVRALQDAGQFSESVEPLRQVLAKNPDQGEANYLLGVALVQTGQLSLAVWPLEKATADPAQSMTAGLLLGSAFLGLQAYEDAVRVATKVLEQDPARVAALKVRAQALLGANQREEALKDTTHLRELAPEDYPALLMHATILAELDRMQEAEKAHEDLETLVAKNSDTGLVARGCLARATFFKDNLKDEARAEAHFRKCIEKTPTEPLALRLVTQFFDERKRSDESMAIWQKALKEAPENLQIRSSVAARYEAQGKADQARATLKEGVELLGTAPAWYALSEFERRTNHPDKAFEAIEQAIAVATAANDNVSFFKADLLIDLNRLDEAETLVNSLKEASFRDLLRGRILLARGDAKGALATFDTILLARGDAKGALATFDAGLKRWPNNAGGRYLAGVAAHQLGDFTRAESEFRESLRVDPAATDASYALATIFLAQGRYKDAADHARSFVTNRGGSRSDGYLLYIRAAMHLKNYEGARRTADALAKAGFPKEADLARAEIELGAVGPDAALRQAKTSNVDLGDPGSESLLRSLADRLVAADRAREAYDLVSASVAKHPDSASLHEIQGLLLVRLGRDGEGQAAFQKALEIDPNYGRGKAGLAGLAAKAGDLPRALALFDEASKISPSETGPAYAAAQLTLSSGDVAGARARFEEIVKRDAGHAGARNDLAWLLAQPPNPELDRALVFAEEAHRIDGSPEITDTLAWVYLQRGQTERAVELFQQAIEQRPESQSIRYHLGIALGRQGERQRALETLRQALEAGPFPEADAAKSELARLEQQ